MSTSSAVPEAPEGTAPSSPRPTLLILYGSQTGCSCEVAERLARSARLQRFQCRIQAMDHADKSALPSCELCIFVCSTTGQGEAPDNMKSLYRFLLRKDLPSDSLSSLRFAVFGLGDSSYPLFNAIARRLHQRLLELGAQAIIDRGLGDDQAERGVDEAYETWSEQLWQQLAADYPLPAGVQVMDYKTVGAGNPKYHVQLIKKSQKQQEEKKTASMNQSTAATTATIASTSSSSCVILPPTNLPPFLREVPSLTYTPVPLQLVVNKRLTPLDHFQDVRHIEFAVPTPAPSPSSPSAVASPSFAHKPGDVLFVHPRNIIDERTIQWIEATFHVDYHNDSCDISLFHSWKKQQPTSNADATSSADAEMDSEEDENEVMELPATCSIRDLFEMHLDVLGTPRRYFFEQLSHLSRSELEKERLQDFVNPVYYRDFARYCVKEKRTYLEALQDFPNSVPSDFSRLVSMIPRLQPRQFSIASAQEMHPNRIHLLLAVLDIVTPFKRKRNGVCSSFLASLDPSKGSIYVNCWMKRALGASSAQFHPPSDPHTPIICFGPGTGVAPFRAMIQQRVVALREREQKMYEMEPETDAVVDAVNSSTNGNPSSSAVAPNDIDARAWPPILLFFGNRNRAADYFYEEEWNTYAEDRACAVEAAFSRDAADATGNTTDQRMRYVQHALLHLRAREVATSILHRNAVVMVAGSASQMPKDVRASIKLTLTQYGPDGNGWDESQAEEYLKEMEKKRRYLVEAW